jgi:hypothetical protein
MIMKKLSSNKNKLIAGLLLVAGLYTSCKKLIEIPPNPPTAITQAEEFADSTKAMAAVAGVYSYNSGSGFAYSDATFTITTGLSADELSYTLISDRQQFYGYTLTALNSSIPSLWAYPYQSIYQANAVLGGITNNDQLSASFKKQITGEMEVVRALYYFNLINLFGAVPLVTSTDYTISTHISRSSVAAVYTQIIADLTDASQKLPASYPSDGRARPNLYTALTLLSKVYLYQGKWQSAYNEADAVIKSGIYSLEPNLNNVFLDGNNEAIWQLPAIGGYQATAEANNFVPNSSGTTPTYLLTPFLLNAFETGDQRLQNWVGTTAVTGAGGIQQNLYYPYKYKNMLASDSPVEDYMICRLGEVYLIRAEAAAHLGNLNGALADVNIIRARAGLAASAANATSQGTVLAAIMQERRVELFCEWGNRWFDLNRTGTAGTVLSAEKSGWQNNAALYPLPQAQLLLDNLLTQNPGY